MIISLTLNGLILFRSIIIKELHTATCIVPLHLSAIGALLPIFFSPLTIAAFFRVVISCDCSVLYYQWLFGQVLHSGVYPLNILLWTINYLVILKFSSSFVTYRKAIFGLLTIWAIPMAFNFPTLFLTTATDYIDCCETVCRNGSALCETPFKQTFTPRLFTSEGSEYYNVRDSFVIAVPTALVFATTVGSYYIYRKSSIKSTKSLQLRMILLPILMTIVASVHLIAQDSINWRRTQTTDDRFPGVIVYIILHTLWDSNGVVYALMILYFNVTLRHECFRFKKVAVEDVKKEVTVEINLEKNTNNYC